MAHSSAQVLEFDGKLNNFKVQKLVLKIPEIKSIDGNPVFVTKDRAVVVDFKMLLK